MGVLTKVVKSKPDSLRGRVIEVFSVDIDDVCLVRECREFDDMLGINFIDLVTKCGECLSIEEVTEAILGIDRKRVYEKCKKKAEVIVEVEKKDGWVQLLDNSLDLGGKA